MFWNIYSKRILACVRNREVLIWTWVFPILLGTLFSVVFTNLDTAGQFRAVPIAVVDDEAYRQDAAFQAALRAVSDPGTEDAGGVVGDAHLGVPPASVPSTEGAAADGSAVGDAHLGVPPASVPSAGGGAAAGEGAASQLFDLRLAASQADADAMLENGEVDGYISIGADGMPILSVSGNGLGQTIAKSFLDRYIQTMNTINAIYWMNPTNTIYRMNPTNSAGDAGDAGDAGIPPMPPEPAVYTEGISLSGSTPTDIANYYYALLAMVCMYGGFQGLTTMTQLQANLSPLGARRTMAPVGRLRMVAYDLLGGVTVQYTCLLVVVAYINLALGVSFGPKLWLVLLTCLAGSVLGVASGAMVSAISKLKEQAKVAILITVTMVCSFLSGLMVGGINYTVAQKAPAVAWLNPAARITDAFYCLYYYDTYGRYFVNIGIVLAMAAAMLAATSVFVRRQRYESI